MACRQKQEGPGEWVVLRKKLNSKFRAPAHRTESRGVGIANRCLSSSILILPKLTTTLEYRRVLSDGDNLSTYRISQVRYFPWTQIESAGGEWAA
jgi:hypothetical protein